MATILSVVSGKGGVGKSTVAAGLARELAARYRRVLLVDTDWCLCSAQFLLEHASRAVYHAGDVLRGTVPLADAVVSSPGEPDFLAAGDTPPGPDDMQALAARLADAEDQYDYIILDRPAGLSLALESALPAYTALVVCQVDPVSVRGAGLAVERLRQTPGLTECRLVVNRFVATRARQDRQFNLDELCDRVGARLLGVVPEDEQVALALVGRSAAFTPAWRLALGRMAARLEGEAVPLPKLTRLK